MRVFSVLSQKIFIFFIGVVRQYISYCEKILNYILEMDRFRMAAVAQEYKGVDLFFASGNIPYSGNHRSSAGCIRIGIGRDSVGDTGFGAKGIRFPDDTIYNFVHTIMVSLCVPHPAGRRCSAGGPADPPDRSEAQ